MDATRTMPPDDAELMQVFSTGVEPDDAFQPVDKAPKQDHFSDGGAQWYVQTQYLCRALRLALRMFYLVQRSRTRQRLSSFPQRIHSTTIHPSDILA